MLMMPTWMYSKSPDGINVNLFVGSTVKLDNVMGTTVELVQKTHYPWDGKVTIVVNPSTSKRFVLRVRVPQRDVSVLYTSAPAANGITSIEVNGAAMRPAIEQGYAIIDRTWKAGDRVELELPMTVQRVRAIDRIEADRGKVALRYGPIVYNIEKADVGDITKALSPDSALTTEWRGDLLGGVVAIKGTFTDGSPLLAIPNYVRMNREPAPPPAPPPTPGAPRPAPPPVASTVWITERA